MKKEGQTKQVKPEKKKEEKSERVKTRISFKSRRI
ncbi:hypothetical protein SAMN06265376_106190 [Dokdonia pacifica]|uniref:Uncharacterized protein n=1 Tax=Dokdonia pacifica TaxID=1627892 RepID=A0A239BKE7_9FLAO|nr:hypothetical protein SAMN06265376_106190 [Dokdonia pacifica]